jgi:hypothetical protein
MILSKLLKKVTAFSRIIDQPNINLNIGLYSEVMGRQKAVDYSKVNKKMQQKTQKSKLEDNTVMGET